MNGNKFKKPRSFSQNRILVFQSALVQNPAGLMPLYGRWAACMPASPENIKTEKCFHDGTYGVASGSTCHHVVRKTFYLRSENVLKDKSPS